MFACQTIQCKVPYSGNMIHFQVLNKQDWKWFSVLTASMLSRPRLAALEVKKAFSRHLLTWIKSESQPTYRLLNRTAVKKGILPWKLRFPWYHLKDSWLPHHHRNRSPKIQKYCWYIPPWIQRTWECWLQERAAKRESNTCRFVASSTDCHSWPKITQRDTSVKKPRIN